MGRRRGRTKHSRQWRGCGLLCQRPLLLTTWQTLALDAGPWPLLNSGCHYQGWAQAAWPAPLPECLSAGGPCVMRSGEV